MPGFSGQLGSQKAQQGLFQLGAAGDAPYTPPLMPISARPWMAHLYNNDWAFRASLGAIIGQRPKLRQALNSGFQPITVELPILNTKIQPGNLIVITEEGGDATGTVPAGNPVIGGIVEQVPDTLDVQGWKHEITITPFVAELGDAYLNKNYTTATDVAQMVRDAVAQTNHLRVTPYSCPNTGITALYNFSYAPCLEVVDHARLIAGTSYSWFVDAIGVLWFQAINTTGAAIFTVKPPDIGSLRTNGGDISGLKNFAICVGGIASGATGPTTATYTNPTSQTKYGLRALNPPPTIPGVTDQTTMNNIAATVGAIYDRVINRVTIELPAYANRVLLGQPGGSTMRYFSPSKYPLAESETGTGAYSPTYVVLDVETNGIQQTVTLGDVPPAALGDVQYQVEANLGRLAKGPIIQSPFVSVGSNVLSSQGSIVLNSGGTIQGSVGTLANSTGLPAVLISSGTSGPINVSVSVSGVNYVAVNSKTFTLSIPSNLFVWSSSMKGVQSAGTGVCSMGIQLDGLFPSGSNMGLSLQGDVGTNASGTTVNGPFSLTYVWLGVTAGTHTLSVVGLAQGGSTYICDGVPNYFVLGG